MVRAVISLVLVLATATASAVSNQGYVIAPGDVISIQVFGEPDLSLSRVRVPGNGVIAYPLIGRVTVTNHSEQSLERHITSLLLNGYLKDPDVTVTIERFRPVFVKGEVDNPGFQNYSEGLTVEKAIALAGGFTGAADRENIMVTREGRGSVPVAHPDQEVLPGDIVTVARQESIPAEPKQFIYLNGEVRSPGSYDYRPGLTIEKAVTLAGGFTDRASKRKIDITRYPEGGEPVKMRRVPLTESIEAGDVISVGASLF